MAWASRDNDRSSSTLGENLSEIDALLEDIYSTEEAPLRYAPPPSPKTQPSDPPIGKPPLTPQKKNDISIDDLLKELNDDITTTSSIDTTRAKSSRSSARSITSASQELEAKSSRSSTRSITSASKELDDLMASLGELQIEHRGSTRSIESDNSEPLYTMPVKAKSKPNSVKKPPIPKPTPSTPPKLAPSSQPKPTEEDLSAIITNDLDAMLKNMTDMTAVRSKGACGACGKPVMGEVTTALGKVWHPEHFVCAVCEEELGTRPFFERDGKPYCEVDYHKLFSPSCAYCSHPILGQCVTALSNTWHPEHFFCAMCHNTFGTDGFHEHEGKPYCRTDYYNNFAPKCGGCSKPILTAFISALNTQWHPECFTCRECLAPFTNSSFFEIDGHPFCETHYHLVRGSLCGSCQKPITGRCITAMGDKFHPEHFLCSFCRKQLNKGTFKEHDQKPYCHHCFAKLFSGQTVG